MLQSFASFLEVEPVERESNGTPGFELLEALTNRELEVLKLLAQGFSVKEAANELVLSPNTVRSYTLNIYSKLNVHGRVEAINKARELMIL